MFMSMLIDKDADVEAADAGGSAPVHIVVRNNHVDMASVLLQSGASVDKKDALGATLLHIACQYGRASVVAEPLEWELPTIDAKNLAQTTPLYVTAEHGCKRPRSRCKPSDSTLCRL